MIAIDIVAPQLGKDCIPSVIKSRYWLKCMVINHELSISSFLFFSLLFKINPPPLKSVVDFWRRAKVHQDAMFKKGSRRANIHTRRNRSGNALSTLPIKNMALVEVFWIQIREENLTSPPSLWRKEEEEVVSRPPPSLFSFPSIRRSRDLLEGIALSFLVVFIPLVQSPKFPLSLVVRRGGIIIIVKMDSAKGWCLSLEKTKTLHTKALLSSFNRPTAHKRFGSCQQQRTGLNKECSKKRVWVSISRFFQLCVLWRL